VLGLACGASATLEGAGLVPAWGLGLAVEGDALQENRHVLPRAELMRVGVDARCLNRDRLRGMGKFLSEAVVRAGRLTPIDWQLLADRPDLPFHRPSGDRIDVHLFEMRGHRFHAWEQVALPRSALRLRVDLLHCPASTLPWWQPVPTVVTLHDALPWIQDEVDWPRGWYVDHVLPRAFLKCAAVTTDSESSRRDIVGRWPSLASKLYVIPLGIGDEYLRASGALMSEGLQRHGLRRPYLLYVGGSIPRKRPEWAIQIWKTLADSRVTLAMCGIESAAQDGLRASLAPDLRSRLCFVPFVEESEMPCLYQNAAAVLYPTLYEGFGLPALEAQAVGVPVLFSSVGSLQELKGPSAIVLPTHDLDAWVEVCRGLIATHASATSLNQRARDWARQFSWDVCAERTLDVYRAVLSHRRRRVRYDGGRRTVPSSRA
jgi:alpha-1,3-rhamnosyl/mannosyltransferase